MRYLAICLLSVSFEPLLLNGEQPPVEALALYQKTEYRAAIEALRLAESKDPAVWQLAGQAHFQLGEYSKAQEWFERAAEAEPKRSEHAYWLGKTLGRRAQNASFLTAPKLAVECRKAFERAVEIDPKNLEAWSDLFEYQLEAPGFLGGGLDKATPVAARIGQLDPAEGRFALARLAEKREDWAAAEKSWRAAIEVEPNRAGRWIDLAKFLARRGRHEESDRAFEQAAIAEPGARSRIWFARAETNIRHKRNTEQAKDWLNRYLSAQVTPDDPSKAEARRLLKKIS